LNTAISPIRTTVHPVTLEVVRNAVASTAEEMRVIMMRSARSPLMKEAGDFSCAITDREGELIAEGRDNPVHLGVMAFTVRELLKYIPRATMQPGDMYLTNLLHIGGNHLPDVKLIAPVFFEGEIVAFVINLAHWLDVGGTVPGSYYTCATEIYQEGLQIPPIRLFSRTGIARDFMDFITVNLRGPAEREGDILAQFASNSVAMQRLDELFHRYGRETTLACFARFQNESEALMRAAVRTIPDGVYCAEDFMDDDGITQTPIRVFVTVTKHDDAMRFDFAGTDPQTAGPINTTYFGTCSGVFFAVKSLVGPHIPVNAGCYRPFEIIVPEGTLLNRVHPAPVVGGNHETTRRVVDVICRALAPSLPHVVRASSSGTATCMILSGKHPNTGNRFICYENLGGGHGASDHSDGISGMSTTMGNMQNTPIEALETSFPMLHRSYGLADDTGGQGKYCGGLAIRRVVEVIADEPLLTTMVDRVTTESYGLFGGGPGAPAQVVVNPGTTREIVYSGKINVSLQRGDVVLMQSAGGGGFGPKAARNPELLARDEASGFAGGA